MNVNPQNVNASFRPYNIKAQGLLFSQVAGNGLDRFSQFFPVRQITRNLCKGVQRQKYRRDSRADIRLHETRVSQYSALEGLSSLFPVILKSAHQDLTIFSNLYKIRINFTYKLHTKQAEI